MYQLKIKTLDRKGWRDKDKVMFHACFQLLTDFIELEKPQEIFDLKHSKHKEVWKEIFYLYKWWNVKRPTRKKLWEIAEPLTDEELRAYNLDSLDVITLNWKFKELPKHIVRRLENYRKKASREYDKQEKFRLEDQEHLERLIKVREHLWT